MKRQIFSETCMCGHTYEDHHCGIITNPKYIEIMQATVLANECCYYGSNEDGGLGPDGEERARWSGTC